MALQRRALLQATAGIGVELTGCSSLQGNGKPSGETPTTTATDTSPPDSSRYRVQTPLEVVGTNVRNDSYTVTVLLERCTESEEDFQEVRNRSYEFQPDSSTHIGEFEEAGTYRLTVELEGEQFEETDVVPMRDLADCNYPRLEVHLHDSEVTIGYTITDAGCPPQQSLRHRTTRDRSIPTRDPC